MPTDAQYQRLLGFRTALRSFEQWSRQAAEEHGITHTQHQLLLAVRGSATPAGPTIGEVADSLLVKPHTAGGLVDRLGRLGYVERLPDAEDHRKVRLRLTERGEAVLRELTEVHVRELRELHRLLGGL